MASRDSIEQKFFKGDDPDFVNGAFDGAMGNPLAAEGDEYKTGYHYGRAVLPFENPLLWADMHQCRS